jgi:hypothetical protein
MKSRQTETPSAGTQDKQLQGIALETVLEKRRLGQAMNAKEFAVCVGRLIFDGVIFWQDFVEWRAGQNGSKNSSCPARDKETVTAASKLPPRAAQILLEA